MAHIGDGNGVGDVAWRSGDGVGTGCLDGLFSVAPRFADFSGKEWESKFPRLLEQYYQAVGRFVYCGSGGVCSFKGFDGDEMDGGECGKVVSGAGVAASARLLVDAGSRVDGGGRVAAGVQYSAGANGSRESDLPGVGVRTGASLGAAGGSVSPVPLGADGSGSLGVPGASQDVAGVSGLSGRGKNYARNLANRLAQKERKKKRKMLGVDWRDRKVCDVAQGGTSPVRGRGSGVRDGAGGLWNSCPEDVRQGLVDSKARWHIAANRRKAAEEEEKLKRLESPTAVLVQEMIRVTGMANKLKNQTANAAIGGWAEVVADSLTRSVAESAVSSVPSLESVGYGQSALRSSGGDTTASRCADYDRAMQAVKARFEHYDSYCEEDYDFAVKIVKDEFADVAYTPEERLKQEKATAVVAALSCNGMGYQTIEDTLEKLQLV